MDRPPLPATPQATELPQEFETWIRSYAKLIRAAISRVGGPRAQSEADEIEQKVLIALWKQFSNEQKIHHPSSYIYRAAVRETVRAMKSLGRRQEDSLETILDHQKVRHEPQKDFEVKEKIVEVRAAISELREPRRKAVQAHLGGYRVQEIMKMHNWSYQKARNLIARGMKDLRNLLQKRGIHE